MGYVVTKLSDIPPYLSGKFFFAAHPNDGMWRIDESGSLSESCLKAGATVIRAANDSRIKATVLDSNEPVVLEVKVEDDVIFVGGRAFVGAQDLDESDLDFLRIASAESVWQMLKVQYFGHPPGLDDVSMLKAAAYAAATLANDVAADYSQCVQGLEKLQEEYDCLVRETAEDTVLIARLTEALESTNASANFLSQELSKASTALKTTHGLLAYAIEDSVDVGQRLERERKLSNTMLSLDSKNVRKIRELREMLQIAQRNEQYWRGEYRAAMEHIGSLDEKIKSLEITNAAAHRNWKWADGKWWDALTELAAARKTIDTFSPTIEDAMDIIAEIAYETGHVRATMFVQRVTREAQA